LRFVLGVHRVPVFRPEVALFEHDGPLFVANVPNACDWSCVNLKFSKMTSLPPAVTVAVEVSDRIVTSPVATRCSALRTFADSSYDPVGTSISAPSGAASIVILAVIEHKVPFLANRLHDATQGLKRTVSNNNLLPFDVLRKCRNKAHLSLMTARPIRSNSEVNDHLLIEKIPSKNNFSSWLVVWSVVSFLQKIRLGKDWSFLCCQYIGAPQSGGNFLQNLHSTSSETSVDFLTSIHEFGVIRKIGLVYLIGCVHSQYKTLKTCIEHHRMTVS
jgi:hypothetical protein